MLTRNHYFVLIFYAFMLFPIEGRSQQKDNLPNIVWIVSEDNSKHYLNLYDREGAYMPNLEALAKNGIIYNNAFSNAPVCSVARSTIISGCYAPRIGAQYHRKMQKTPMPEGLKMFPHYLKKAGYYTTNNAKEDYNLIKSPDTWDESSRKASYKNRAPGQAFFHVQNFGITHEGNLHFSEFDRAAKKDISNLDASLFPCYPETDLFRYTNAYYRQLHQQLDTQVGEFIAELDDQGLLENTIIFYYGDHGGVLPGSKGYIYERGVNVPMVVFFPEKFYHLSPVQSSSRTNIFVQFIDLAPTVLNIAGISIPEQMDGRPFLGVGIEKKELEDRDFAFSYADRFDEKYDLVRAVRKGKYKYIRNYQPFNIDALFNFYRYKMLAYREWEQLFQEGKLNENQSQFFLPKNPEALYDLESDPHETVNLINDSEYQKISVELQKKLYEHVTAMPDLSFYPESYFLENGISNPVAFGQKNKMNIKELVDIADLQLLPYSKVKRKIRKALKSKNPWKRYWGLIVCTTFGTEASAFYKKANRIIVKDSEGLNKIRAMEFLALNNQKVDYDLMIDIIKRARTETECNLMLNSVALIKTMNPEFRMEISKSLFDPEWVKTPNDLVNRRIDYINQ